MSTRVLGAGMTGLAVGRAAGLPVYEAAEAPGGICASYYVRPGSAGRLAARPAADDAYRFEIGGGHWIFGGDPAVLRLITDLTPCRTFSRVSSVYFPDTGVSVPYPLQHNLRFLGADVARRALAEMAVPSDGARTMKEWLQAIFGPTLAALFFEPFHALYTAGLHERIAPQDAYKSPVDPRLAAAGASGTTAAVGYNATYLYPEEGLDTLARRLGEGAEIRYGKRVVAIDIRRREVAFADGTLVPYRRLISTLPLSTMIAMTGVAVDAPPDPFTSVLVLNVGAVQGERCPPDHWLYTCRTRSGFHRVGFYSNVDPGFLPAAARAQGDRVSLYVERAFVGGERLPAAAEEAYARAATAELRDWGFIGAAEVVDATWIEVAYTWALPGSCWRAAALRALEAHDVFQVGRYGRWIFQGIADSIRDGLFVGSALGKRG